MLEETKAFYLNQTKQMFQLFFFLFTRGRLAFQKERNINWLNKHKLKKTAKKKHDGNLDI